MHALSRLSLAAAVSALTACTSTYHPEYHPVTVTSYEQHVSSPAGATLQAPAPPTPPPPPPWSEWPGE
jgi:hypothetical protein